MSETVDRAMRRLAEVASSRGVPGLRRQAMSQINLEVSLLQIELEPLTVPADAARWWTSWDVEDLAFLHDDDFIAHPPLTALAERQLIIGLEHPHVLLPVMREEKRELALELAAGGSPGGRVFEIDFHGGEIRLIGSNMADLVDLLSDALEGSVGRTADHERLISWDTYADLVGRRYAALGRVSINPYDRGSWPTSWLHAAGHDD